MSAWNASEVPFVETLVTWLWEVRNLKQSIMFKVYTMGIWVTRLPLPVHLQLCQILQRVHKGGPQCDILSVTFVRRKMVELLRLKWWVGPVWMDGEFWLRACLTRTRDSMALQTQCSLRTRGWRRVPCEEPAETETATGRQSTEGLWEQMWEACVTEAQPSGCCQVSVRLFFPTFSYYHYTILLQRIMYNNARTF